MQGFSRKILNDRHEYLIATVSMETIPWSSNSSKNTRATLVTVLTELSAQLLCVENHPQDSRVKINEDGVVQTLSGQMGTGGGMFL